jgi:hypothetical protein
MATYYMNEGAFEVPEGAFVDRTVHALEAAHPEHGDVSLLVRRVPFPEGKTLRELVQARLDVEKQHLAGYTIIEEREAAWAGAPALEIAVRWRHEGKVLYQRQAHFALDATWMSFSVRSPFESRAACDGWLAQIRDSVRLRDGD